MKNVTVVFYENPAAQHNLKAWENEMQNAGVLVSKETSYPDIVTYTLPQKKEIILCFPTTFLNFERIIKDINKCVGSNYKTLLFGKFELNELDFIMRIMSSYV